MTNEDFNEENDEELLRADNELKRLKIEMNGGKIVGGEFMKELPPEIENIFLNNILSFESQIRNSSNITIHEKLGFPDFVSSDDLSDEMIKSEIEHIKKLLFESGIVISTRFEVAPKVFYDFLTGPLLKHEIADIKVKGMINHLLYEDFVPNALESAKELVKSWAKAIEEMDIEELNFLYTDESKEKNQAFWQLFFDLYDTISLLEIEFNTIELENNPYIFFSAQFECTLAQSNDKVLISGNWRMDLKKISDDFFQIIKVDFPKMEE